MLINVLRWIVELEQASGLHGVIKRFQLVFVRLNLFNHVLALFHAKFACNLAIRYLVFRWELCKGSV